jgi:cytochrome c-type biogenesis protein CcmH
MKFVVLILAAGMTGAACSKRQPEGERPAGLPPSGSAAPAPVPAPPPPPPVDDQMVAAPPDAKQSISGTITLPAARKRDVAPTDIVFIIARRAGGPPGPGSMLAVQKHPVGQFPMPFTLSGRDAMVPGTPFEGSINITVRLDKDGDGLTRKKGDLYGQVNNIGVGSQDVAIPLDSIQTEDQTLAGGAVGQGAPAPGGARPPGHP